MQNQPQSKMTMAVLCLLLGGLGIHRKLMGYDKWWLMIVVTIFTLGFGGGLWALVDLIRILTGSLKMANGEALISLREKQKLKPAFIIAGALVFLVLVAAFLAGGGARTQIEGDTAKIRCEVNSFGSAATAGGKVAEAAWRAARANPDIKKLIVTVELTDRLTDPNGGTETGPHIMGEIVEAGEELDDLRKIESMSSLNFTVTAGMYGSQIKRMRYGHFFK